MTCVTDRLSSPLHMKAVRNLVKKEVQFCFLETSAHLKLTYTGHHLVDRSQDIHLATGVQHHSAMGHWSKRSQRPPSPLPILATHDLLAAAWRG